MSTRSLPFPGGSAVVGVLEACEDGERFVVGELVAALAVTGQASGGQVLDGVGQPGCVGHWE
jgi:hypothetical protein